MERLISFISNSFTANSFVLLLMFGSLTMVGNAQQTVNKIDDILESAEHSNLLKLSKGIVPSLIAHNGQQKLTEEIGSPIRVITDLKSMDLFYQENEIVQDVEIIVVLINNKSDLDYKINGDLLHHLDKLKYIYVSSSIELCLSNISTEACEKQAVESLLKGDFLPSIKILYSTELSE